MSEALIVVGVLVGGLAVLLILDWCIGKLWSRWNEVLFYLPRPAPTKDENKSVEEGEAP